MKCGMPVNNFSGTIRSHIQLIRIYQNPNRIINTYLPISSITAFLLSTLPFHSRISLQTPPSRPSRLSGSNK